MKQVRLRKTDAAYFQYVPWKRLEQGETIGRRAGNPNPGGSPSQLTAHQLAACQRKPPGKGIRIIPSGAPALARPVGPERITVQRRDQCNSRERTLLHVPNWGLQRPTAPILPLSIKHHGKPARPRVTSELYLPTR